MKRGSTLYADGNGRYAYVSAGFSWPAFFLGPLWAVAKRRWWWLLPMFCLDVVLSASAELADSQGREAALLLASCAQLSYLLMRGWYGNRWLAASLERQGYTRVG
ncbi:DUF2628 domain-containing protein [Janthinobacterium sp. RB2R34]|uniref:DUF2628 domain-containing protein n=1 Tax=Janthinobacterium sp. RB2R34 TaxID=3424193 RepID=UPI003F1F1BA9